MAELSLQRETAVGFGRSGRPLHRTRVRPRQATTREFLWQKGKQIPFLLYGNGRMSVPDSNELFWKESETASYFACLAGRTSKGGDEPCPVDT